MPLSFETLNRGAIAFGFFNIETDMLLLDRHFLFADLFCAEVAALAAGDADAPFRRSWPVFTIRRPEDVGDLMGAIHGVRHTGFIGETYRRWPFPARPEDFKQAPEGHETRGDVEEMVDRFAEREDVPFAGDPEPGRAPIGEFSFSREGFQELVRYVWRGGYPRWRDEIRPAYVLDMRDAVAVSGHWLLRDIAPLSLRPPTE